MPNSPSWWTTYFDDVFLRIYRPLLGPEVTAEEIDALVELLAAVGAGGEVLDVGCGWGRHSLELARRGFAVTGVDLSALLLAEAGRAASEAGVTPRWVRADMRELPFRPAFDVAISLFSTFGYFPSAEDDIRALRGIRRALRGGGFFLLDTMHRDLIARDYVERDWWPTPTGERVWVERSFDAVAGVSDETLHWQAVDGSSGTKNHRIRVRSASEWNELLRGTGFAPVHWFGDWDLRPFNHTSPRLIVLSAVA